MSRKSREAAYGIQVGRLRFYWTRPWAIWWGEKIIWNSRWW